MIVTVQDFDVPPYDIPDAVEVQNSLQDFIDLEEAAVLKKILGRLLYDAFKAALDASLLAPPNTVVMPDRFLNLMNGDVYRYKDIEYKWEGMAVMLKPYLYSVWTRDHVTAVTSSGGESSANLENGEKVNPARRIVDSWNVFSTHAGSQHRCIDNLFGYLYNSGTTYEDIVTPKGYDTFLSYLMRNFKSPKRMNIWSL
jgi:hypothetical protein